MNFEELLKACTNGLPKVKTATPVNGTRACIGQVTVIKDNGRHKGIGVQFPGLNYDTWFGDDPGGTDKRKHYMHELSFA